MQILVLGVWKTVCCLENGSSMLVASLCVLFRLALNQGQHPWESNPEGVTGVVVALLSRMGKGNKCSFIPFMGRLVMFFGVFCDELPYCSVQHTPPITLKVWLPARVHFSNLCVRTSILLAELVLVLYLVARCEGFLPLFVAKANLSDTLAEARKQLLVFHL